jgi:transcriptional regulator with GAF, ATPase, and Fis domain
VALEDSMPFMIGHSVAALDELIGKLAPTDYPVLVTGETGTGKELVATRIHEVSPRRDRPFVIKNCAAIPVTLAESELFGHVRGAFTGAESDRAGAFEFAQEGTLFLDEIGELPLEVQAKLLRALEQRQFSRVGENRVRTTRARVIAATNRNLEEEVVRKRFREDLLARLNVLSVHLLPLRDRPEDIPLLIVHFLETLPPEKELVFTRDALHQLQQYHWPTNIRELRNTIIRLKILCDGPVIDVEDLPDCVRSPSSSPDPALCRILELLPVMPLCPECKQNIDAWLRHGRVDSQVTPQLVTTEEELEAVLFMWHEEWERCPHNKQPKSKIDDRPVWTAGRCPSRVLAVCWVTWRHLCHLLQGASSEQAAREMIDNLRNDKKTVHKCRTEMRGVLTFLSENREVLEQLRERPS